MGTREEEVGIGGASHSGDPSSCSPSCLSKGVCACLVVYMVTGISAFWEVRAPSPQPVGGLRLGGHTR